MDRLSEQARVAVEAFRDRLNPDTARVEQNWAAIERQALTAVDEPPAQDAAEAARAGSAPSVGVIAGVGAASAVCVAMVLGWVAMAPGDASRAGSAPADAAAYGAELEGREECANVIFHPELTCATPSEAPSVALPQEPPPLPMPSVVAEPPREARPSTEHEPRRRSRSKRATPAPSATDASSRALEEIKVIRRARVALRDDDASTALRALDEYRRRFGEGEFAQEATVLRIVALCGEQGREAAGRRLARQFLDAHPHSPLAGQAARACETSAAGR